MANYYGDDFGDRMEADQLMAQLEARARQARKDEQRLAFYRATLERARTEGRPITSWKNGSGRKGADATTPTVAGDLEHQWVGVVVHPDGRIEGPNAERWRAALNPQRPPDETAHYRAT